MNVKLETTGTRQRECASHVPVADDEKLEILFSGTFKK